MPTLPGHEALQLPALAPRVTLAYTLCVHFLQNPGPRVELLADSGAVDCSVFGATLQFYRNADPSSRAGAGVSHDDAALDPKV
jgi:hypothetical protein